MKQTIFEEKAISVQKSKSDFSVKHLLDLKQWLTAINDHHLCFLE